MAMLTTEDFKLLKTQFKDALESVRKVRDMSDDQEKTFLLTLNNAANVLQDGTQRRAANESVIRGGISQPQNIAWFPQHMINMTARMAASSILEDLVWVQAIDSPMGQVVFFQSEYGDTRGDNGRGDVMINDLGATQNYRSRNRYASGRISGEPAAVAGGEVELHCSHLPMLIDADNGIIFTDAANSGTRFILRRTGANSYELKALDTHNYAVGNDLLDTSKNPVEVDPESGLVKFTAQAGSEFAKLTSVYVDYTQDLSSAPALSGRVRLVQRVEPIQAMPHKLRVEYSFDAGYMYQNSFGIDIQKTLIDQCTMEMKQERDNEVIDNLLRQAGNKTMWDRTNTNYISQREHDESFIGCLNAAATTIFQRSQNFRGNWAVVGTHGLNILMNVGRPRFEPNYVEAPQGPYVAGILDNNLKVICSPYLRENEFLVGHKSTLMNASALVADYLPIMHTDWLTHDTFKVESGFISYWGYKLVRPELLVRGEIKGY